MNFSELIGLFISLGAFLFILFGQGFLRSKTLTPKEEEERKKRLREFLKAVNGDMVEEEEEKTFIPQPPKPKPKPKPVQQPAFQPAKPYSLSSFSIKAEPLPIEKVQLSPFKALTARMNSRQKMVVLKELIDKPRAYHPWNTEN